jgi:hypothetical protein
VTHFCLPCPPAITLSAKNHRCPNQHPHPNNHNKHTTGQENDGELPGIGLEATRSYCPIHVSDVRTEKMSNMWKAIAMRRQPVQTDRLVSGT